MVAIFFADGFEEIEAITTFDILKRAGIEVKTVGVPGNVITGAHGLRVTADFCESDVQDENFDAYIFPGGMPGAKNLSLSTVVNSQIKKAIENKAIIAAICAAPGVLLSNTGALDGKKWTCFPGFETNRGSFSGRTCEKDGNLITANGPAVSVEFALSICESMLSENEYKRLKEEFK